MDTSLDASIREHIVRYLASESTLHELEEWFVPTTWNTVGRVPLSTERLIGGVELRLAEYTSGHRTEEEVRVLLREALEHQAIDPPPYYTGAETTIIWLRVDPMVIAGHSADVWLKSAAVA